MNNKYLKRIVFPAGEQREFLNKIQEILKLSSEEIAIIAGVHARTIRDWKREKFLISLDAAKELCKKSNVILPKNIEIREPFWYVPIGAKAGGLASYKKYGSLSKRNKKYRKKKWLEWWEKKGKFNQNQYFLPKDIFLPKNSVQLAEFVGILLGDGSISDRQISITLNGVDDLDFSFYVKNLVDNLFSVKSSVYTRKSKSILNIVVSRTKLVKFMLNMGLKIGSKVRQQTGVPKWINKSEFFTKSCMKGLLDTDGCFYIDKHKYKSKIYLNCGINFTNRSLPILNFFKDNLIKFGYHPTQKTKFSIFLRREEEIIRYFKEIGSSNPKHSGKFSKYYNNKFGEVPKWT